MADEKFFAEKLGMFDYRRDAEKRLANGRWEMSVVNAREGFCFLRHPDFDANVFCRNDRLSGGVPQVGDRCRVSVEISYDKKKGVYGFAVSGGEVTAHDDGAAAAPRIPKRPAEYHKPLRGGAPFDAGSPRTPAAHRDEAKETFYTTREEFFKACRMGREEDVLAVYLNMALTNLFALCPELDNCFGPEAIAGEVMALERKKLEDLASFLFLFLPAVADRSGYADDLRENCAYLIGKLAALRNFFVHRDKELKDVLRVDTYPDALKRESRPDAVPYSFFGKLEGDARKNHPGCAEAVSALPLFRKLVEKEDRKYKIRYELTKHGIVFLCCMALYKNQAQELCRHVSGMRCGDLNSDDLIEYFVNFSFRRGRQLGFGIDKDNPDADKTKISSDLSTFADIVGYLNKVPKVCLENLSLNGEREKLRLLEENSTASSDRRDSRFRLQERAGDKFATYALSWFEDFGLFGQLGFKHLDTKPGCSAVDFAFDRQPGLLPTDRHFIVRNGNVHFEWRLPSGMPHHGDVKIAALHGAFGETILQQLFYLALEPAGLKGLPERVDKKLSEWFCAYHALLEKMLDRAARRLPLKPEDFLAELAVLAARPESEVRADFSGIAASVLGPKTAAYFECAEKAPSPDVRGEVVRKILAHLTQSGELEERFRTERIPDQTKIRLVFEFFDLKLAGTPWRFRQLPMGQQHRGCVDYEYQTIHALIGKYTVDPKALWKYFRKMSEKKLEKNCDGFMKATKFSFREVSGFCRSREELLEHSRVLKRAQTLDELAFAALRERVRVERRWLRELADGETPEEWSTIQALYGVRETGGGDPDDIFRTILKIDRKSWEHGYDYRAGAPARGRDLAHADDLIVPQIAIPEWLIPSVLEAPEMRRILESSSRAPWNGELQAPDIRLGIRRMELPVALRDYYNVETLTRWLKDNTRRTTRMQVCSSQRSRINKARGDILRVYAEDTLLGAAALRYWQRFYEGDRAGSVFSVLADDHDFYNFYMREIPWPVADGHVIGIRIHDLNKAGFASMIKPAVTRALFRGDDELRRPFGEMQVRLQQLESQDLRIRIQYTRRVLSFYEGAPETPKFERPAEISRKTWEEEVLYRKIAEFLRECGYAARLSADQIVALIRFRNALMHHEHLELEREFRPDELIGPALDIWEGNGSPREA